MNVEKCKHFDRGFCKYKDLCAKVHPNEDCQGPCEDKRTCQKRHKIPCKNGPMCKWTSCEFLHRKDEPETESAKIKSFDKIVQEKIEAFAAMVNRYMDNMLKIVVKIDQDLEVLKEKVDTIEKEFSSKLEENEKACHKVMTKADRNKTRLTNLESKQNEVSEEKETINVVTEQQSCKETVLEETSHTKGTNSINGPDRQCEICNNKLKTSSNLKNHEAKFHNQQQRCTFCSKNFESNKTLESHITAVHKIGITKHTLEREPSLANHKQKKNE